MKILKTNKYKHNKYNLFSVYTLDNKLYYSKQILQSSYILYNRQYGPSELAINMDLCEGHRRIHQ